MAFIPQQVITNELWGHFYATFSPSHLCIIQWKLFSANKLLQTESNEKVSGRRVGLCLFLQETTCIPSPLNDLRDSVGWLVLLVVLLCGRSHLIISHSILGCIFVSLSINWKWILAAIFDPSSPVSAANIFPLPSPVSSRDCTALVVFWVNERPTEILWFPLGLYLIRENEWLTSGRF